MTKYILKRVGYSIVTLFLLVAITFFMMQLLPGDRSPVKSSFPRHRWKRFMRNTASISPYGSSSSFISVMLCRATLAFPLPITVRSH